MPASATQVAPAQSAGRNQPQTTIEQTGGPFIRYAQLGRRAQYASTANAFGALITQPLVAVPGYIKGYRVRVAATTGAGTTTVAVTADAPFNSVALVQLKDAFGTVILSGPGYEILYLIQKYGGQFGVLGLSDITNLPNYSAPTTGASASGNFTFATYLPFEFAKAYGCISGANASLLPTLQFNLNPSSSVYSTAPNTTVPVLEFDVDADFYWLPQAESIEPPGLGTTCQWSLQACNPTIGSASSLSVNVPRLGGYATTLIFELRSSLAARIDAWPTRWQFFVDGVPLIDTRDDTWQDDMQMEFAGISGTGTATTAGWTRDTGIRAITRKGALGKLLLGLLDTGEQWLSTNPGTALAFQGMPWGVISNAPATLYVLAGLVVPAGTLVQGLPEL